MTLWSKQITGWQRREKQAAVLFNTFASAQISGHPAATADGTRAKGFTHAVGLRAGYLISSRVSGVTGILSEWTCFEACVWG